MLGKGGRVSRSKDRLRAWFPGLWVGVQMPAVLSVYSLRTR